MSIMEANIDNLRSIFDQMKGDGVKVEGELLWSFFFFDADKIKIDNLKSFFDKNKTHKA